VAKRRTALILSLFALGIAGCGGDDDEGDATTVPTIPLSVPGEDSTLSEDESTTGTTVETTPDTSGGVPAPAPTPTPTPTPPAQTPDSPDNDTPPPQGSEAEQFESFCDENPGACP
jgi:hypothetical protein